MPRMIHGPNLSWEGALLGLHTHTERNEGVDLNDFANYRWQSSGNKIVIIFLTTEWLNMIYLILFSKLYKWNWVKLIKTLILCSIIKYMLDFILFGIF